MGNPSEPGARAPAIQVSEEKYTASLHVEPMGARVQFRGTISSVNPASVLNPFVDQVHEYLLKSGARDVRVDFTELEFCNSSGFKSFIYWIQKIQSAGTKQYRLRFISSPARKWQRTSLLALSCYSPSAVEIG
jgi:anti-anti-sigma regulatory factor